MQKTEDLSSPDESLVVVHLHERIAAVKQDVQDASQAPDVDLITVILSACNLSKREQDEQ